MYALTNLKPTAKMKNHYQVISYLLFVIMIFAFFVIKIQGETIKCQARDIIYLRQENIHLKGELTEAQEYIDSVQPKGGHCE